MNNKLHSFLILFLLGASMGAGFDYLYTVFGVSGYTTPTVGNLPWWVFPEFGLATVLIGFSHPWCDTRLHRPQTNQSWGEIFFDILCFGFVYLLSAALSSHPILCSLTLFTGGILMWVASDKTWQGVLLAIITAIIGTGFEMTLSASGQFFYTHPHFWGVPFWLPLLYASASMAVGNLGRKLLKPVLFNPTVH